MKNRPFSTSHTTVNGENFKHSWDLTVQWHFVWFSRNHFHGMFCQKVQKLGSWFGRSPHWQLSSRQHTHLRWWRSKILYPRKISNWYQIAILSYILQNLNFQLMYGSGANLSKLNCTDTKIEFSLVSWIEMIIKLVDKLKNQAVLCWLN